MLEKDIIREAVRNEWNKLSIFEDDFGLDDEKTKIQLAIWYTLDDLWCTLYDEEY